MGYSEIGNVAACCLQEIPKIRGNVTLDEFIVMPNHVHCILEIKRRLDEEKLNQYARPVAGSVSVIINQYKGAVKKWCDANGYAAFKWQGRFHDHVIRNNEEYRVIKNYIINNPANWQGDRFRRGSPRASS